MFWFVAGAAFTLMAMNAQGGGTWASLLRVGSDNPALGRLQSELGPIVTPDRTGHDGQLYYLIARDPFAEATTPGDLAGFDNNGPRYRYRRILFPLLAGGFGQFGGKVTLAGMISLVVFGMGLATVAVADVASQLRLRGGAALLAAFNVGALISAMILTADALALGLAMSGVALSIRRKFGLAIAAFGLAALTKEVYVLVPLSVAAWQLSERRPRVAAAVAIIPLLPLLAWSIWVWVFIPETVEETRHFGPPLSGILTSAVHWKQRLGRNYVQLFLAGYALLSLLVAIAMLAVGHSRPMRWVAAPWVLTALCSTAAVWKVPGNAARGFSILWPVGMLLLVERLRSRPPSRSDTAERET
ncbi:MAG TPA: hypothetical protein VJ813_06610 [Vicinamibacterales bacterium]|nr:hypothetical protein [Vicinamibacterales bacterium]